MGQRIRRAVRAWSVVAIATGIVLSLVTAVVISRQYSRGPLLGMLTINETVGLAFCAGTPPCVKRRANPAARDALFLILDDRDLVDFHLGTANALGWVCRASDISRIEEEIARRAPRPAVHFGVGSRRAVVAALCMALAIMDLRGIDGASPALRRMAASEYWRKLEDGSSTPRAEAVMADIDVFRCDVLAAYALTRRGDVEAVLAKALAGITEGRREMLERSLRLRLKTAEDSQRAFDMSCSEAVQEHWVQELRDCWNNDLRDPLGTTVRQVPSKR